MPKPPPGWYVYLGSDRHKIAMDKFGPFDTRQDIIEWMREHNVRYRPNAEAYERAVLCWSEMTDSEVADLWGTALHKIEAMS